MKYITLLSLLSVAPFFAVAEDPVSLNLAATQQDQDQMGISSLNEEQKRALENWLGRWTQKVIKTAPSYNVSLTLNQWILTWPRYLQVSTPPDDKEAKAQEKELSETIFRNYDGERLILNNGSEWEVYISDRSTAKLWVRDTPIKIRQNNQGDIAHPYILSNPATGQQVGAKKIKDAVLHHQDDPGYFRGTFQLHAIDKSGAEVRLINNMTFKIAPIDQLKVSTTWKLYDRIRVDSSNDTMYPYTLNNLDSGGKANANKK